MRFSIQKLARTDERFPDGLRHIPEPPEILYCLGNAEVLAHAPSVAIVGTRRATRYGLETARDLARDASNAGIAVVSGLALGIDAEAHTGALAGKSPTIAVLGSGLNHIVPMTNRRLAEQILETGGAIVSEFEPDMPAETWTFPQRNRIIAGLAEATIVIEAPEKSGALITARFALDFNRDVGAVPGEITSINSKGTNQLLKEGAALIRTLDDVYELLGLEVKIRPALDIMDENDNNLLRCLETPQNAEMLADAVRTSISELLGRLTRLELAGKIENRGGLFHKTGFKKGRF
ncbi:MAG: DNA-protecting protein DprA [Candidatus Niyogibacteria bacterium]|nr:DNA-protecting protein DprA [Candidatus Niyogibacteria bacterium]